MKKFLATVATFYYFSLNTIVSAQNNSAIPSQSSGSGSRSRIQLQSPIDSSKSVWEILVAFFQILIQIGAVAVTLAIVYAGFLFVAAQGNPEKINQARKTLFYTIIGALVLLGSQVIASVIQATIKQVTS